MVDQIAPFEVLHSSLDRVTYPKTLGTAKWCSAVLLGRRTWCPSGFQIRRMGFDSPQARC